MSPKLRFSFGGKLGAADDSSFISKAPEKGQDSPESDGFTEKEELQALRLSRMSHQTDELVSSHPSPRHSASEDRHGDAISAAAILAHSSFAFVAHAQFGSVSGAGDALLERLAKAFTRVAFAKGEALPESPFLLVGRGSVAVRMVEDARCIALKRAGTCINWSAEFSRFSPGALRSAMGACCATGRNVTDEPRLMELVGATDGHAYVLTSATMRAFMELSEKHADLVQSTAAIGAAELPVVAASSLSEKQVRQISTICTFRYVPRGAPVLTAAERGHAFAVVVRGVVAPVAHGPVAAALPLSKADSHWKALSNVASMLGAARKLPNTSGAALGRNAGASPAKPSPAKSPIPAISRAAAGGESPNPLRIALVGSRHGQPSAMPQAAVDAVGTVAGYNMGAGSIVGFSSLLVGPVRTPELKPVIAARPSSNP